MRDRQEICLDPSERIYNGYAAEPLWTPPKY